MAANSNSTSDPVAAQAAASLQLLLQEDPGLVQFGLTTTTTPSPTTTGSADETNPPDSVAFSYAAALLASTTPPSSTSSSTFSSRTAAAAVQEVDRKLALTESLAVKLSRTSPEAVAGHLLRLHGYESFATPTTMTADGNPSISDIGNHNKSTNNELSNPSSTVSTSTTTTTTTTTSSGSSIVTLAAMRDRAARLERAAEHLEGTCARVETSVTKAYDKLSTATARLERVLAISSALKTILRLQFETAKLLSYDLDDVRDLTRAAAAVAVLEQLLASQQQQQHEPSTLSISSSSLSTSDSILVVERMRPAAVQTAAAVRRAASILWQEQQKLASGGGAAPNTNTQQLGAVLQIYFHLGELPAAVWQAVDHAHAVALTATRRLFQLSTLQQINDQVAKLAQSHKQSSNAAPTASSLSTGSSSVSAAAATARETTKWRKQVRATVTVQWAHAVLEAATLVRTIHRVLLRKSDPVTRTRYVAVVAATPPPAPYSSVIPAVSSMDTSAFSIFDLFWTRFCSTLASTISSMLADHQNNDSVKSDVAALYPAVRAAALEMVSHLQESSRNSTVGNFSNDGTAEFSAGILGGISSLSDPFLNGYVNCYNDNINGIIAEENPQAATTAFSPSADTWTTPPLETGWSYTASGGSQRFTSTSNSTSPGAPQLLNALSAAAMRSSEWESLQGRDGHIGLYPLQQVFLRACQDRLTAPLQYMFPETVAMDDAGVALSGGLALLPSKYDIQRFDENIRLELSLADPREGGGDSTAVTMIAECVVSVISDFCVRAKTAMSGVGETGFVNAYDWSMTESLQHDRKIVAIMYTLKQYLQNAPEKTFVAPYRPAVLPQHLEAANLCTNGLAQALTAIDSTVKFVVLLPLCRALNRRIGVVLAKMHSGVYLDTQTSNSSGDGMDDGNDAPSFVQKEIANIFDMIAEKQLARFPPAYSSIIATNITSFTIYTFLSNASLIRPLRESARLHLTQDLADLEMVLEQFVAKTGSTLTLHQVEEGKPYAELRASRQMLFWTGLENRGKPAEEVAKSLLREVWIRDTRVSTLVHYLFSFAPSTLSSPHHVKRISAADYVHSLVQYDGSTITGEDAAWLTIMSCCESYAQRASVASTRDDGDPRIAQIIIFLGQELLRRRGRN